MTASPPDRVRIGCSGWNYPSWRGGAFYPRGLPASRWLGFYAERYDTVEVNSTFYRLPRRDAVSRWADDTPRDFTFAVKVSRYLTHIKRLRDAAVYLERFLERVEPLADAGKLGPLLWQLPPTFQRDDERLAAALSGLPPGLRHAVEFRHESWFTGQVWELLREHNVALVIADLPAVRSFQTRELTADFVYVRFHEGSRGRRGNYSERELLEWRRTICRWSADRDVYVYFNNDWEAFAPANASMLKAMIESARA